MKKGRNILNTKTIFGVLRAAVVAAGALGTLIAVWLVCVGVTALSAAKEESLTQLGAMSAIGLAEVAVVSVCCYIMLAVFFRLCGRLRSGHAFTEENAGAMRLIAALCTVCGGTLGVVWVVYIAMVKMVLLPILWLAVVAFAFFGVALIAYALCLLVRRAAMLQRENELTI